jgi:D-arabinose 1-dehydrogenase-like Zn-dependent alcohol dehydrogenase
MASSPTAATRSRRATKWSDGSWQAASGLPPERALAFPGSPGPAVPYALLWGERRVQSVANLTRADGERFMRIAAAIPLKTEVATYSLEQANAALEDLRAGSLSGAAVLIP